MSASPGSAAAALTVGAGALAASPAPGPASAATAWRSAWPNGISRAAPKMTTMTAMTIRFATEMSMNDQLRKWPGVFKLIASGPAWPTTEGFMRSSHEVVRQFKPGYDQADHTLSRGGRHPAVMSVTRARDLGPWRLRPQSRRPGDSGRSRYR